MNDTLVINKNFYAIHVIDWKRAISLLYQGHADAVDENFRQYSFDDWVELSAMMKEHPNGFVHSVKLKIAVPEIIKLTKYNKLPKREVKFTRRNIYSHYKYLCCYCGKKFNTSQLNLDHVIPKSRGGKTNWSNIVTTCIDCNTRKRNLTPEEARMRLLVKPSKPKWKSVHTIQFDSRIPIRVSWQRIIDTKYWNTELEPE